MGYFSAKDVTTNQHKPPTMSTQDSSSTSTASTVVAPVVSADAPAPSTPVVAPAVSADAPAPSTTVVAPVADTSATSATATASDPASPTEKKGKKEKKKKEKKSGKSKRSTASKDERLIAIAAKSGSRNQLVKIAEYHDTLSATHAALSEEARALLDAPKGGKKRKTKAAPKKDGAAKKTNCYFLWKKEYTESHKDELAKLTDKDDKTDFLKETWESWPAEDKEKLKTRAKAINDKIKADEEAAEASGSDVGEDSPADEEKEEKKAKQSKAKAAKATKATAAAAEASEDEEDPEEEEAPKKKRKTEKKPKKEKKGRKRASKTIRDSDDEE